jgi:putative transposase
MDVPEAKLLKHVEEENAKLKKLLAEHMLDAAALLPLSSAKASRICRPLWACRNGGPVR